MVEVYLKGRITNHDELCNKNSIVCDVGDRELVCILYNIYGEKIVYEIEGDYAIVISDNGKYLLIRDRIGFKSLFYVSKKGQFNYGFDLKEIIKKINFIPEINSNAIYQYLTFLALPEDITWFQDVRKVEPGTYVVLENDEIRKVRYYNISSFSNNVLWDTEEKATKRIVDILLNNIDSRESKYAIALSGGVDSCLLAAISSLREKKFETISVYINREYNNEEMNRINSIKGSINPTNMCYRSCILTNATVSDAARWIAMQTYEPMQLLDMILISSIIKEGKTTYLFGEGADELGGYIEYIKANEINNILQVRMKKTFLEQYYKGFYFTNKHIVGMTEGVKKSIWMKEAGVSSYEYIYRLYEEIDSNIQDAYLRKLQNVDFSFRLPEYLLRRSDIISSLLDVKIDFPFLSRELVEYCLQINKRIMIGEGKVKKVFKNILYSYIPRKIWDSNKIGMGDGLKNYLEIIVLDNYINEIESKGDHPLFEYVDRGKVGKVVRKNHNIAWSLYSIGVWLELLSKFE